MEKSSKRGKIPQQDWPSIIERYEAGETLASIARTYDCSPPAISYIVSRTRARGTVAEAVGQVTPAIPPAPAEPQLLKGPAVEMAANNIPAADPMHNTAAGGPMVLDVPAAEPSLIEQSADAPRPSLSSPQASPPQSSPSAPDTSAPDTSAPNQRRLFSEDPPQAPSSRANDIPQAGNGPGPRHAHAQFSDPHPVGNGTVPRPVGPVATPPQNGESRRTLHLSLSQGNGSSAHTPDPAPQNPPIIAGSGSGDRFAPRPPAGQPAVDQHPRQGQTSHYSPPGFATVPASAIAAPNRPPGDGQRIKEGGAFIDRVLRERVDGDIAAFLAAFDAALDHDTSESRTELREATDRLLRAGARTRIELERLEARAPLPARDKTGQTAPLFRHR